MLNQIICGDALETLKKFPENCIRCCITSPPYFNLRNYDAKGQIGLEPTIEDYIAKLVAVFAEVRRVLTDDGTLWVNIADCYSGSIKGSAYYPQYNNGSKEEGRKGLAGLKDVPKPKWQLPRKNLLGLPWRLAFALQEDGWILRQDIIWSKTNCMPESVTDRCTKSHEYIFLLAKEPVYFYNHAAIMEPVAQSTYVRMQQNIAEQRGSSRTHGGQKNMKAVGGSLGAFGNPQSRRRSGNIERKERPVPGIKKGGLAGNIPYEDISGYRNKRSVWSMSTSKIHGVNHYATFPEELAENCILAGSEIGDTVLDVFNGSGTTCKMAKKHGRNYLGIDINADYCRLAEKRVDSCEKGLF